MKKVVVAGCLCLDITPEFHDSQEKRKTASEWFLPGKLLQVGEASIHTGEPLQIPDLRSDILARMCR